MGKAKILDTFKEIVIESPVDRIIKQIRDLITSGQLNPGDRLPSERKLAEVFGVGRSQVRDALAKLEFYGILKTLPQSGTVVAGIGITALEGLITDVLKLHDSDFASLVETRVILETQAAWFAAERRTEEDIESVEKALKAYEEKVNEGLPAVEEDLLFHLKIAEASKNSVLKSLMLIITPDIVKDFISLDVCGDDRPNRALQEHHEILNFIKEKKGKEASDAMRAHLTEVLEYSMKNKPQ
ncbi:MAG: FadR/GntR family transcriptional regulator [Bacteroidota bacterium]